MRKTFLTRMRLSVLALAIFGVASGDADAQTCSSGTKSAFLDINNVRAPVFTTGSLFYPDLGGVHYEIPKGSGLNANYATNVWVGGKVNGQLRTAAATYAQGTETFEFYPGPLGPNGTALTTAQCASYDRIWKINRSDLVTLNTGGSPTTDILEWPWQLGAPVADGDGNPNNYSLAGGDRPEMLGDQMLWWIMNDKSGPHNTTLSAPIGLQMAITAFAFSSGDALNNTTFYKYRLTYNPEDGVTPLTDAYIGVWADVDLGYASDDFVGVDTTLGLGFTYNGDAVDDDYGPGVLPAIGIDFFQGPLVDAAGETWADPDGTIHTDKRRLGATRFIYYNNTNGIPNGNPDTKEDFYNYLSGFWLDGLQVTEGGNGRTGSVPTRWMYPGNPPGYWSEDNIDGNGTANQPEDRRLLISTGPFELKAGETQDIVFGMVWSQAANRFGAVAQLKADDILAQGAFDFNFNIPSPPNEPDSLSVAPQNGALALSWLNLPTNNNYLNQYNEESPFLVNANADDKTYTFEGYNVYQINASTGARVRVATMDVANNITTVTDDAVDAATGAPVVQVTAYGNDTGVENFLLITKDAFTGEDLNNYTEYCFAVEAYAYNAASAPKVRKSASNNKVCGTPQRLARLNGGQQTNSSTGDLIAATRTTGTSDGTISARVVDPSAVTGATYRVTFENVAINDSTTVLAYKITNTTTGAVVVDGAQYARNNGQAPPYGENVAVADGLSFTVITPSSGFKAFLTTHNATSALTGVGGAFTFNGLGWPAPSDPTAALTGMAGQWGINNYEPVGLGPTFDDFEHNSTDPDEIGISDFEIRFTAAGSVAGYRKVGCPASSTGGASNPLAGRAICYTANVPFELWNIGVGTPTNTADDYRLIPYFMDVNGNGQFNLLAADHSASGGANDPYTEPIYWGVPTDKSPGQAGYLAAVAAMQAGTHVTRPQPFYFMSLVSWNGGLVTASPFAPAQTMPPTGAVFRIETKKPIIAGDVYAINTSAAASTTNNADIAKTALEDIGIVPNPYRGSSTYDPGVLQSEVRFVNLPMGATARVFTLSGQLVKTVLGNNDGFVRWDLRTEAGLPVASGLYLVHVDVPGVGEKVIKFGVVQRRSQLTIF